MTTTTSSTTSPDRAHDREVDTDVVVVGAGPIGLTLACALAHHGVRYRVFEERTEPNETSRANNLWSRPQELLEGVGVRSALAEKAYPVSRSNVVVKGKALPQDVHELSSPFPEPLYTGQDVIETTLEELSARTGSPVERGRRVLSLSQDADGVELVVGDGRPAEEQDGHGERVRCRYVVGSDGNTGTVRGSIGVEVPVERFEGRATRQVDARLGWRRSNEPDQLWFFPYHHGFAGVLPIWGGYHRVFFLEEEGEVDGQDPTLEEMQGRLREITGDQSATLSDPIWFSHGRFQHGVAPVYARDRVFLAGDAGHRTIPIGGQGMNAGLHDSVGLAWRLAMTLAGDAGEEVLASYSPERQRAHVELDDDQSKGFRQLMYRGRVADAALDVVGDRLPGLATRIFGGGDLQQVEVAYPDSPLTEEHLSARPRKDGGTPLAGGRAPDARVVAEDGEATSVFSCVYGPDGHTWGWCLLGFDGGPGEDGAARERLAAALAEAGALSWVHPRLVVADPAATGEAAGAVPRLFDLDGAAHEGFGLRGTPALVLTRPDGHIAFRAPADRADLLQRYLGRVGAGEAADRG